MLMNTVNPIPILRQTLLGIYIDLLTIKELNTLLDQAIAGQQKIVIANHNLHSVYLYHHNAKVRQFYRTTNYVHIDGMILVFLAKLLGKPAERKHRITYLDWVHPLMTESVQKHWRIFYLGSKPGIAEAAAEILRLKFPGLCLKTHHGYFNRQEASGENANILKLIADFQPNILMVGMGMPRQELWIMDNLQNIGSNIILPCGACMDYIAGAISTPPRWMGRLGVEWLFRLVSEPRRLWERYLIEPWYILKLLLVEALRHISESWRSRREV